MITSSDKAEGGREGRAVLVTLSPYFKRKCGTTSHTGWLLGINEKCMNRHCIV